MASLLAALKSLIPILEPIGEQGVNQLWSTVVDPYIATVPDSNDLKPLLVALSPAVKSYVIVELQKLKS